ncbi:MAG: class I SAM-dependent methyltransferase [Porticoccaceae bacterium]
MRLENTPVDQMLTGSGTQHMRILAALRARELDAALSHFPPPTHKDGRQRTVLEIGAGTGQQAKAIQALDYHVVAIDLASSHYRLDRIHPVIEYDGRNIPMADGSADIIFSSNVLEHVRDIEGFLDETRRVLARDGVAVHILPTSLCRFWSIPAHYVWLAKRLYARVRRPIRQAAVDRDEHNRPRTPNSPREWLGLLFPMRHGERGVTLTEIYYYSSYWWKRTFRRHGFLVMRVDKNHLFYTMANALADSLGLAARHRLSRVLGSACHIYVLRPTATPAHEGTPPASTI